MPKYISIDIPTKKYIKAYMQSFMGDIPIITTGRRGDFISNKIYDLLEHSNNERNNIDGNTFYSTVIRVRLPLRTFRVRGHCLNYTNIRYFNLFVEDIIKKRFYELMDDYMEVLPSFINNLPEVRRKLGILDADDWSDDSMQKNYYRYRLEKKLPIRKKKVDSKIIY